MGTEELHYNLTGLTVEEAAGTPTPPPRLLRFESCVHIECTRASLSRKFPTAV